MNSHEIKIFQCKDGSLFFFANLQLGTPKDVTKRFIDALIDIKRDGDRILASYSCDFKFYNLSESQLKEMEIKETPENAPAQSAPDAAPQNPQANRPR